MERCMLKVRHLFFLACVVPAISLCPGDSASAARVAKGLTAAPRPAAGRPVPFGPRPMGAPHTAFAPPGGHTFSSHPFNRTPHGTPGEQFARGADHGQPGP